MKSPSSVTWDCFGNCTNPYLTTYYGRPEPNAGRDFHYTPGGTHTLYVDIYTRCRKCDNCLQQRAVKWRMAAKAEIGASARTWFGTLTLRPEEQARAMFLARQLLHSRKVAYSELDASEQFKARCRPIMSEVTKWLKRVRKNSGAYLRYLLVVEKHKSGDPHLHLLVHEKRLDQPVTHKCLTSAWRMGFTKFNLVTSDEAAFYVSKYLSKSLCARVRASQRYGKV